MSTPNSLLCLSLGGALGAVTRHLLALILNKYLLHQPNWAIFTINMLGCFAIGNLTIILLNKHSSELLTLFIITGFLGSFTTYSTFALHSVNLLRQQDVLHAIIYVMAHTICGLLACFLGILAATFRNF